MSDEPRLLVYAWRKNSREEVRATLGSFNGRPIADIRVWVVDGDRPTRKGISVRVEDLPRLEAAVEALMQARREEAA